MKLKQLLALLAIVILVGMYALTVLFAIFDNPATMRLLAASLAMTILVPTLMWIIKIFVGLSSPSKDKDDNSADDAQ